LAPYTFAGSGLIDVQEGGVELERLIGAAYRAVERIPNNVHSNGGEVDSDLMGSTCR